MTSKTQARLVWHLEKLPYFLAVAECGSFGKASVRLRIAQPSLSKAIGILEEACGVRLFERQKSGATLTDAGRLLADAARDILRSAAKVETELAARPADEPRRLGLVTHELLVPLLAPGLAAFVDERVHVHVQTNRSVRELIASIEDCQSDAGVVAMSPPRKTLHFEPLFTDSYRFVCTPAVRDRLAPSGRSLNAGQLRDLPVVLSPNVLAAPNETLEAYLQRLGLTLEPKHIVGSLESVAALAAAGLGVGLLPLKLGRLLQGDKLVELRVRLTGIPDFGRLGIYFCCRSDAWRQDALMQELYACVKASCAELAD